MEWIKIENEDCDFIYARVDDDGLIRVTATPNSPEVIAWLNREDESGTL